MHSNLIQSCARYLNKDSRAVRMDKRAHAMLRAALTMFAFFCWRVTSPPKSASRGLIGRAALPRLEESLRHASNNSIVTSHPPRVALCFFGLTRSLSVTRPSLRRHVLDVLTSHGWTYDIFLHTYRKKLLTNPRSKETRVDLNADEWRYLRPTHVLIEDGDEIDARYIYPMLPKVLSRGDLWRESAVNHTSMANFLGQLRSIEKVTGLLLREKQQLSTAYDAVIFLRPDVWFFNDIDMHEVESVRSRPDVMFIPGFHAAAGLGEINDRFVICHPGAAETWGLRQRLVDEYVFVRNQTLHSERLLGYVLRKANITVKPSTILFGRMRANKVLWGQPKNGTILINPKKIMPNALGGWRVEDGSINAV